MNNTDNIINLSIQWFNKFLTTNNQGINKPPQNWQQDYKSYIKTNTKDKFLDDTLDNFNFD